MRRLVHGRQLVCRGFRCDDGQWEIEGRLVDIKTRDVRLPAGACVAAGEPYRALALAVTVDDDLTIRSARVEVEPAAQQRASAACRALAGRHIDALFGDEAKAAFAHAADSTHLAELLAAVISTARETIPLPQRAAPRCDADD
ncbi:MAG TPA: DUF2889 domain-containing protein [Burkholderiales bacterium]|nr:DUF2889 domain-containing protein [Burkholderiales bacterium]